MRIMDILERINNNTPWSRNVQRLVSAPYVVKGFLFVWERDKLVKTMQNAIPNKLSRRSDRKILIALLFAAFGMLLFIALALTLPQGSFSK
jgi:hypothetical protein